MAVHRSKGSGKEETPEHLQDGPHSRPGQAPAGGGGGSWGGSGGGGEEVHRPWRRSQMGDVLASFRRSVSEHMQDAKESHGVRMEFIPLDSSRFDTYYSCGILVALKDVAGTLTASAHVLILEGSARQPASAYVTYGTQKIEVKRTAMDSWDVELWNTTQEAIVEKLGDSAKIINAGATVIPNKVEMNDQDRIWQILWGAQEACLSTLEAVFPDHFPHFNIQKDFSAQRERLTAAFAYNDGDEESIVGLPVRSDIRMSLQKMNRDQMNQASMNSLNRRSSRTYLEATGFVDLAYTPPQQQTMPGQPQQTQIFVPRMILTDITTVDVPFTPEMWFLGLATSMMVGDNYAWAYQFANYSYEEIHDIGAVGYRMPNPQDPNASPQRIDTKSNDFGDAELYNLIQTVCYPKPAFSVDCEDAGPSSWFTGALVDAAHGSQGAHQFLVRTLDNLTNGAFSSMFPGGPIATSYDERIHLGTYTDAQGRIRDLREMDSLAALSLFGARDMKVANEWEATFNDVNAPVAARLERRLSLIQEVCNNVKLYGFAERVTFTPEFLEALVAAVDQAGLRVDQEGLSTHIGTNYQVGNPWIAGAAMRGSTSGILNTMGPSAMPTQRPMGRW